MWRYLYTLYKKPHPSIPSHLCSKSKMHNKLRVNHIVFTYNINIYILSSSKHLAVPLKLSHPLSSMVGYRCIDCGCGPSRGLHRHFFGLGVWRKRSKRSCKTAVKWVQTPKMKVLISTFISPLYKKGHCWKMKRSRVEWWTKWRHRGNSYHDFSKMRIIIHPFFQPKNGMLWFGTGTEVSLNFKQTFLEAEKSPPKSTIIIRWFGKLTWLVRFCMVSYDCGY